MHRLTKTSILDSLHSISASAELCCLGATGVNYSLLIRIWLFFFFFFFFSFPIGEKKLVCVLSYLSSSQTFCSQGLFAVFRITD